MATEREEAEFGHLIGALRAAGGEEVGIPELWVGEDAGALWLHDPVTALADRKTCVRLFYCSPVHPSGDGLREVGRAEMRALLRTTYAPDIRRAVIRRYLEWRIDREQAKNYRAAPPSSALDMGWAWGDTRLPDRYRLGTDFYGEGERGH